MNELIRTSAYCGVVLSLGTYFLGSWLKKKLKWRFLNPLLLSILFTVVVLLAGGVDYDSYNQGAKYLSYLLTPATVCLAVPLYEQFEVLKRTGRQCWRASWREWEHPCCPSWPWRCCSPWGTRNM